MKQLVLLSVILVCSISGLTQQKRVPSSAPAAPARETQLYRNASYGFRYQIPYGWVDRSKEMQEGNEPGKGEVLLATFERPPEAEGDTVNSAVVIATENAGSYPGLKRAEDYLGPLTELTRSKGFKAEGDPQSLTIDSHSLVRADFVKPLNGKLTMHQSTLLLLQKGRIVSFTFIAGDEDEVNDLIQRLTFAPARSPRH